VNFSIEEIPLNVAVYKPTDDGDFIFVDVNSTLEKSEGITKDALIGKRLTELFPGIEEMGLLQCFRRVNETGEDELLELALYEDKHKTGWKRNNVTKLANGNIAAFYEDVTENNQEVERFEELLEKKTAELESQKKELDKRVIHEIKKNREQEKQMLMQSRLAQMGEMLSMIAHQWRQPLGAIASASANLKLKLMLGSFPLESEASREECSQYFSERLENIEGYVDNLTTTIDDFRNFYKPNKTSVELSLKEVVEKSIQIIGSSLKNNNIKVVQECNSEEIFSIYDSEMIQVVLNILNNAQDNFLEKNIQNSTITIKTNASELSICDNGGGIPEDIIENIFDPYFSTKHEKNGTGLGLYMSKMIVEEHHSGTLQVVNIDGGVCFHINLKGV